MMTVEGEPVDEGRAWGWHDCPAGATLRNGLAFQQCARNTGQGVLTGSRSRQRDLGSPSAGRRATQRTLKPALLPSTKQRRGGGR
jgi:hypothetical protein